MTFPMIEEREQTVDCLHNTLCRIRPSEGKGRGVFASREIPAQTIVEISPVLLFGKEEYDSYGRHTLLDHYTFNWPDGRMALALGLGSLFNHSSSPNVSFSINTSTDTIRYTTTRPVQLDEELCIFYGHKLWFELAGINGKTGPQTNSSTEHNAECTEPRSTMETPNPFACGATANIVPEEELPFVRTRVIPDDDTEDEEGCIKTMSVWVVDVPDPKKASSLLRWVKESALETPDLQHLKRIRRSDPLTTLLLSRTPSPPPIPEEFNLPPPYIYNVPATAGLTPTSFRLKLQIWPTVYAPKKKGEPEPWSRAKAAWAWEAIETLKAEAKRVRTLGELPIVSYVPRPFSGDADRDAIDSEMPAFLAYDTRNSAAHQLRHSVFNVVRKVADWRASHSSPVRSSPSAAATPPKASPELPADIPMNLDLSSATSIPADSDQYAGITRANGMHYLLTSLTLFTTHEPCVMCSMALLHSRVRDIVFIYPMDATGGCGGRDGRGTCVPRLKGVNHRYNILRWKHPDPGHGAVALDQSDLGDVGEEVDA